MSFNHGAVWWSELRTRDVGAAMAYYGETCGWTFEATPMTDGGDYQVAVAHGKPVAGMMDLGQMDGMADVPPHWFSYFAVDDVDVALDRTRSYGGQVLREAFDVPGIGRIGIVRDPGGAALGLMTPVFPGDALVEADRAAEDVADDGNFPV